ncbi:hypothetical protein [Marinospirillum perlucidum]|uniref:hypothetical protein n=1 Tax=Marinospirillum perlucidum TaxID=1982602 RepID=UPI000DF212ED|nr:hypothetical protein [Marinospirillum perlucidum]
MTSHPALRQPCPPSVCDCDFRQLVEGGEDLLLLQFNRKEEKRLLDRLENLKDYPDLLHLQDLMQRQLGISLSIQPGPNEVKSPRGLEFIFAPQPGLCRRTRQNIPTAIRKSMKNQPEILYQLLDAQGLFGQGG